MDKLTILGIKINFTKKKKTFLLKTIVYGYIKLYFSDGTEQYWLCNSGGWGRRTADPGKYKIRGIQRHAFDSNQYSRFQGSMHNWLALMIPDFETDQTDICIHPDRKPEGSKGCVVVKFGPIDELIFQYLIAHFEKSARFIPVDVVYSIKPGGTHRGLV